ncbi:hypothetical protein G6O67_006410 [Ophiocordyceps sinensis]|uniref:Uncharacterized protein n=2 Tax=Ophiocordyceps sinensis TaxID=72228 RepID=A0A8H4LWR9_9HYPO|nr:hypothetical protein OCS_06024 [Ophiocordyceps sinensis CO18]KAF4506312.1 hypothetical protein G6O67_006410 [Ophiocordyceps sinensis]
MGYGHPCLLDLTGHTLAQGPPTAADVDEIKSITTAIKTPKCLPAHLKDFEEEISHSGWNSRGAKVRKRTETSGDITIHRPHSRTVDANIEHGLRHYNQAKLAPFAPDHRTCRLRSENHMTFPTERRCDRSSRSEHNHHGNKPDQPRGHVQRRRLRGVPRLV